MNMVGIFFWNVPLFFVSFCFWWHLVGTLLASIFGFWDAPPPFLHILFSHDIQWVAIRYHEKRSESGHYAMCYQYWARLHAGPLKLIRAWHPWLHSTQKLPPHQRIIMIPSILDHENQQLKLIACNCLPLFLFPPLVQRKDMKGHSITYTTKEKPKPCDEP
jgi:hypothetical protein